MTIQNVDYLADLLKKVEAIFETSYALRVGLVADRPGGLALRIELCKSRQDHERHNLMVLLEEGMPLGLVLRRVREFKQTVYKESYP